MTELDQYIQSHFGMIEGGGERLADFFHETHLKKGDYFLRAGMPCHTLSFVRKGLLRVFAQADHKEVTQWISSPSYFITELSSLVFGTPSRWSIQALTEVELYTIHKSDYEKLGLIIPQWPELEKRFITRCFTILEDRVFTFLSMTAEERYLAFFDQNKALFNQVPLQYIASMLGMTPETFSRIRKKLST